MSLCHLMTLVLRLKKRRQKNKLKREVSDTRVQVDLELRVIKRCLAV